MQATRGNFGRRRREWRHVSPSFGVPGCAISDYRRCKYPAAPGADAVKVYCVQTCALDILEHIEAVCCAEAANGRLDAPYSASKI